MKTSLQLKMGQHLTMTPQLQQAIKLLQLSTLDLQQEIQQALDSNPMLEVEEDSEGHQDNHENGVSKHDTAKESGATDFSEVPQENSSNETEVREIDQEWGENIPEDLAVDSSWDDVYQHAPTGLSAPSSDDDNFYENQNSTTDSLEEHLRWQLNLTPMSDRDRAIAFAILDCINADGYLNTDWQELVESLQQDIGTEEDPLDVEEVDAVLHRLQMFDPVGVCSRDLRDCLLAQLKQLPETTPALKETIQLVDQYLNLLGSKDYATIMRRMKIKEDQLKDMIGLIQQLNPRPGEQIAPLQPEYVIPDVIVSKDIEHQRWKVELNPEIAPRLRVNASYASMVKRADSSDDNTYLRDNLQEARWFIKSLQSRNETLLKVATKIVEHQLGFFEYGEEAMKPLVLHDIAEAVDMHESTISRVTTQKYMHTPRGIFELKFFFSSHVSTSSGGECSSTAIRAIIKKLVASENPKKPLSDSKIATMLGDQGIQVARRTIAKYREALNIPPSNERKQLV
ncbi:RNA polymerase factor sigma-54 [Gynuella sunshinyii]|nr:RNA polymerase factor sigma-54 [Gynuella sunshinyii]